MPSLRAIWEGRLSEILNKFECLKLSARQMLFHENSVGDRVYILHSGTCSLQYNVSMPDLHTSQAVSILEIQHFAVLGENLLFYERKRTQLPNKKVENVTDEKKSELPKHKPHHPPILRHYYYSVQVVSD
jgi:hypothetical protein